MDQTPDAGTETGHPDTDARRTGATADPLTSRLVSAALALLLVVSTVFAVLMWRQHHDDVATDTDRRDAVNVAEQFTLRLDTFDYKDLDGYSKRVSGLLTDKMRTDFNGSFKGFDAAFKAIQISSKGTVLSAGVEDIDQDSATVLVIHDVNVKSKGCVQPPYKRMSVDLRKVQGKWLVDDFKEGVPGCQG